MLGSPSFFTGTKCIGIREQRHTGERGFSLIEIGIVTVTAVILAAISLPIIWSTVHSHRLRSAVASATWAIQATRYEAMMKGYPHALTFDPATVSYQVSSRPPGAPGFSNVRPPVPLSGTPVTISAITTLEFRPNGMVLATTGQLTFSITYHGSTKTVTVSRYGNVTVTP